MDLITPEENAMVTKTHPDDIWRQTGDHKNLPNGRDAKNLYTVVFSGANK